jgi:surface antigen
MRGVLSLSLAVLLATAVCAQQPNFSPNRFPQGQCTWYADGRAAEAAWRLRFSRAWGRDARVWPDLIVNGVCVGVRRNAILVLNSRNTPGGAGHVAWVESVQQGGRFTVTHANFASGRIVRWIAGVPIRATQFEFAGPGRVRVVGGNTTYDVRTFIARPS